MTGRMPPLRMPVASNRLKTSRASLLQAMHDKQVPLLAFFSKTPSRMVSYGQPSLLLRRVCGMALCAYEKLCVVCWLSGKHSLQKAWLSKGDCSTLLCAWQD